MVGRPRLRERPFTRGTHTLLVALFVVYLALLTWIVLWKLAVPWVGAAAFLPHPIKLIPFVPDAEAGASSPVEVAINFAIFVPFGLFLGVLAPSWRWFAAAGVIAGSSLVFETLQPLLSIGSFDTTDIIVNTAGGLAGLALLALIRGRLGAGTAVVMTRVLLIGTIVAVVLAAAFFASPLRYEPQHDVVVPRPSATAAF
ncbi:VanZ family protein [Microbacterium sp. BWT-B31]|uniref:VanZ family protein n=1 Tax=Microbacterium sp. BWT-B31 TaxID=3232072 RepID=UPI003528A00E